jgi:hypothetical protein
VPVNLVGDIVPDITGVAVNGYTLQAGDIILVGNLDTESSYEYMQIMYTDATNLYVSRGWGGNISGSISHVDGEDIVLIRHGTQVFTDDSYVLSTAENFAIGSRVVMDHPDNDFWSHSYTIDPNVSTSAISGVREWYPINGQYVPIGEANSPHDTGISLKLYFDGNRKHEPKFSVGDIIRVSTDGLVLKEDGASIRTAVDKASEYKWGPRETQMEKCKFYTNKLALWGAQREVNEEANPKYSVELSSLAVPWLQPLDVVTVQDAQLFPRATEHKEVFYIAEITYDVSSSGGATFTLRGTQAY